MLSQRLSIIVYMWQNIRYKATAPQNSANVAPRAARRVTSMFWGMLIMHGGFFLRHVTLLAIVIGHRATPKKRGAVKDKLFPAFISRSRAASDGSELLYIILFGL